MNELLKVKEELTKERDEQLTEIVKLREQMAESEADQSKLEEAHEDAKQKIQEVIRSCVLNQLLILHLILITRLCSKFKDIIGVVFEADFYICS